MKPLHALLCVLLVAVVATAAPAESGIIPETELEPLLGNYWKQIMAVRQGKLQTAAMITRYERMVRAATSSREKAKASYVLAELYAFANREPEARRECARALEYFPQFATAHVMIGRLAARKKDFRAATAEFRKALAIEQENIAARIWLAQLEERNKTEESLNKARRLFEQTLEIRPIPVALEGLARVCVRLYHTSFKEKDKAQYRARAINAAKGWRVMEPDSVMAIMHLAEVHIALGEYEDGIRILEEASNQDLVEQAKLQFYDRLTQLYMQTNRPKKVADSIRRMLKLNIVGGKEREQLEKRLKDVEGNGSMAFGMWEIELLLVMLRNDGLSEEKRLYALRRLLAAVRDLPPDERLEAVRRRIFDEAMRVLINAPPKLAREMFRFFRQENPSPRLIRILVHFVYPYDDKERTPEVRADAVRTLSEVTDVAALPTLFYCLRDEPGLVLREVDKALVRVCETRSVAGDGVAPLDQQQKEAVRRFWYRFKHSDEGTDLIVAAFEELRKHVELNPKFNRENRTQPLLDQTINVVLLDSQMAWPAWKAGYKFFIDYLGKDFRPVSERDKPIEEGQRAQIVEAVRDWWRASDGARPNGGTDGASGVDAPADGG